MANLPTVATAGGENMPPEDVGMIADAVDFLTAAPHLHRPALVAEGMRHARVLYVHAAV
ncbi:MAG TPA: hypothetical protein VGE72_16260 [Azospirillum sp.]